MLRTAATALLLVAAMLAACSSAASTDRASLADSYWNVLQIVRDGESVPIDVDRRPTLRLSADLDRFSGHSGCNGFSGTLIVGDGSIEFTDAIVTLIGCDRVAQQEEALFDVLERADSYELVDLLVIRDDRGNTATLGNAHAAAIARVLDRQWHVVGLMADGQSMPPLIDREASIRFDSADEKVSGSTGCNDYEIPFLVDGDRIGFLEGMASAVACEPAGAMDQEEHLLGVLAGEVRFELEGADVVALNEDGRGLVLRPGG